MAALSVDPGQQWLVTGAAGFIGSHLVEFLLRNGQTVAGLDNFSTGHRSNLDEVRGSVGEQAWSRFRLLEADVRDHDACTEACRGVHYVLHQAALGSVPRSIEQPLATFSSNVDGFMRIITAARDAGVRRFVYASSSSVYGDLEASPKREDAVGRPLSPYAATKVANELFADVYARTYGLQCIGLRYFNVFGARQDPEGPYAAVIPRWIAALLNGEPCHINGDGQTSRDFCHVSNVVQANLLAAVAPPIASGHEVVNVACGEATTLQALYALIRERLAARTNSGSIRRAVAVHRPFRAGDVRHSLADVAKAARLIGYAPAVRIREGIDATVASYPECGARRADFGNASA